MAEDATYLRTVSCYISHGGLYVCLDTNQEVLSLKELDFDEIDKYEMIIYQYEIGDGTGRACLLRCHNKDKVPHLVNLVPSATTFDIQITELPDPFSARIVSPNFREKSSPDLIMQEFSPIHNADFYLCPNSDNTKLIISREPCTFQVYPSVKYIEEDPEGYISLHDFAGCSVPGACKPKESDLYLGVSSQGKLVASSWKPAKFRMYKYSYKLGENIPTRIAWIIHDERTNKVVCVQKDRMYITLKDKEPNDDLRNMPFADEKFFLAYREEIACNRTESFLPHEYPELSIGVYFPEKQVQKLEKYTEYDVILVPKWSDEGNNRFIFDRNGRT